MLPGDLALQQASAYRVFPSPAAAGYVFLSFVVGHGLGPSLRELHVLTAREAVIQAFPWLIAVASVVLVLVLTGIRSLPGDRRQAFRMPMLCAVPVLASLFVAETTGVAFEVRHIVWAAVPLIVILGAGVSQAAHSRLALSAGIGLLTLFGVSIYHRQIDARYQNEDAAALGRFLKGMSPAPVYVVPGYISGLVRLYAGAGQPVLTLPENADGVTQSGAALGLLGLQVERGSPFWLVYSRPFHADPNGQFLTGIRALPGMRQDTSFAGIAVFSAPGRDTRQGNSAAGLARIE